MLLFDQNEFKGPSDRVPRDEIQLTNIACHCQAMKSLLARITRKRAAPYKANKLTEAPMDENLNAR